MSDYTHLGGNLKWVSCWEILSDGRPIRPVVKKIGIGIGGFFSFANDKRNLRVFSTSSTAEEAEKKCKQVITTDGEGNYQWKEKYNVD